MCEEITKTTTLSYALLVKIDKNVFKLLIFLLQQQRYDKNYQVFPKSRIPKISTVSLLQFQFFSYFCSNISELWKGDHHHQGQIYSSPSRINYNDIGFHRRIFESLLKMRCTIWMEPFNDAAKSIFYRQSNRSLL